MKLTSFFRKVGSPLDPEKLSGQTDRDLGPQREFGSASIGVPPETPGASLADTGPARASPAVVAFVWIDRLPREWTETLGCLLRIRQISKIYVAGAGLNDKAAIRLESPKLEFIRGSLVDAAAAVFATGAEQFLFVVAPTLASPHALDHSISWMEADPRIATISYLSNSAGYLSFPHRNAETPFGVDGQNETTLTDHLRSRKPKNWGPVPIPVAEGGMILVSRSAWDVSGSLEDDRTQNASYALAEFSLRASRRGFNNFLDLYTYVARPWDGAGAYPSVLTNPEARHSLHLRHHFFPERYDAERTSGSSVLAESLDLARAKALGLRILIDGSALGPKEMGTQVLTVKLTSVLARHPDVQRIILGVPDPANIPPYARELRSLDKITFIAASNLEFPDAPDVDIVHRPFQPTGPIPWDRWRSLAKRSVITIQDLIAYRNGGYFQNWGDWSRYRNNLAWQVSQTDAVFSISHDVLATIQEERLSIDEQRLFVVENGADQRSREQPARVPSSLILRGWGARPFLLVLGATYAHKNRDLATRVWLRLRQKGFEHGLVLVGASVPFGSTRIEEAELAQADSFDHILSLPEVGAEERNWLLQNSSAVLYLTAAEGFGLVPFEAACMGVPTLHVSFGPLRELIDDDSIPGTYDVDVLTARAEELLSDPSVATGAVQRVLKSVNRFSWAETGRKTVEAYFETLSQPSRLSRN